MTDNRDKLDVEQYLAGKDSLSRQYKLTAKDTPPLDIDEAILAASRKAVAGGPDRTRPAFFARLYAPLAIAAVVVLSVLVMLMRPDERLISGPVGEELTSAQPVTSSETAYKDSNDGLKQEGEAQDEREASANLAGPQQEMAPDPASTAIGADNYRVPASPPGLHALDDAAMMMQLQEDTMAAEQEAAMMQQQGEGISTDQAAALTQQLEAVNQQPLSKMAGQMPPPAEALVDEMAQADSSGAANPIAATILFAECTSPRPQVCTMQYLPVCATRDNGLRCVTTPCASTEQREYSNACHACADPAVSGYTADPCPVIE